MGSSKRRNRRAKERAKERARAKQRTGREDRAGPAAGPEPADAAAALVIEAVRVCDPGDAGTFGHHAPALADLFARAERAVERVLLAYLLRFVTNAWRRGWQPAELVRQVSRRTDARVARLATDLVAAEMRSYAEATVDEDWRSQLAALGARVWWDGDGTPFRAWRDREDADLVPLMTRILRAASVLAALPRLPALLSVPGTARRTTVRPATGPPGPAQVTERVLGRVRALLAKAESTEFPEEAEALTGRAQELMARHSIDQALLAGEVDPGGPGARRLAVDSPYEAQKTALLSAIAKANRCRAIWHKSLGLCTVVGFPDDVDAVELLFTSLLVQATTALVQAGSREDGSGRSRTRSFRRSFLSAYAHRIGERLAGAAAAAEREAAERESGPAGTDGGALLPVLAARDRAVEDAMTEMFPDLGESATGRVGDYEGWLAGLAAADLAALRGREEISPA